MIESEIDAALSGLVKLKDTKKDEAIDNAIKALKEFRKQRTIWRRMSNELKTLKHLQKLNLDTVDRIRKSIFGRGHA
jgi:hypothetical protein